MLLLLARRFQLEVFPATVGIIANWSLRSKGIDCFRQCPASAFGWHGFRPGLNYYKTATSGRTVFFSMFVGKRTADADAGIKILSPMDEILKVAPASALEILVVDDNRDAADTLALLIKCAGHQVRVAYDGPSALLTAQTQKPDVVLLDIGLPKIDGYNVASRLREQPETKDATIIAVTGYGTDGDKARARGAGFDFHVLKPASVKDLLALISGTSPKSARDLPQESQPVARNLAGHP
ncbi:MAG: response regulator [Planctomycetales bacterium]|nr:response regulator [Planctomycetales bacterium]